MVIIGNDIGLNNNAIVVCTHHEGKLTVIDKYYVNLSKYKSEGYKLQQLYQQYLDVFSKYVNPVIVYEHPVMKGNVGAMLNGVVSLLKMSSYQSYGEECTIIPVSPKTLKLKITGSGLANKKDILFSVRKLIDEDKIDCNLFSAPDFKNDHLIDSLGCCYYGFRI